MKVRNRCGGPDYEVVEGLVVKDAQGILHTVEKAAFEEVPTDRWEDVTQYCAFQYDFPTHEWQLCYHRDGKVDIVGGPEWRLSKVQLHEFTDEHHGPKWAFLVERKVSE